MSDKHLRRQPRVCYDEQHSGKASKQAWWYEEPGGVCVVIPPAHHSVQIYLRWGQLEEALKRKRKNTP